MTLKMQAWPSLKETYLKFTKEPRERIRRTTAYSLHEVAQLLASSEVEPVFDAFAKDSEDVRQGIIDGLPQFIATVLDKDAFVAKHIELLCRPSSSWRMRVQQAFNLAQIAKYISEDCCSQWLPFYFSLCTDEVAEVRI